MLTPAFRSIEVRAEEIASYLRLPYGEVLERLSQGFHHNHALVAEDFRAANTDVDDDVSLLNWYRSTTAYIFELSAYHLDERFNYAGMCEGIRAYLANKNVASWISSGPPKPALILGDGIGDLSLYLQQAGLPVTYHDLKDGLTAGYAKFSFARNCDSFMLPVETRLTNGWEPDVFGSESFSAVVALDFFEHLVNVEDWVRGVYDLLCVGGEFLAQNAFAIGDAEHGDSIPMHLSVNNRFEKEWDSLLVSVGFVKQDSGWWKK